MRLREKQRLRAQYGLREKQMTRTFAEARKEPGLTGEAFVELLEMRLDALVLRAGFARTILQARQTVLHRHILVDGKIVDRPSFRVSPGQTIQVKAKAVTMEPYMAAAAGAHRDLLPEVPDYLDVQLEKLTAQLRASPQARRGSGHLRSSAGRRVLRALRRTSLCADLNQPSSGPWHKSGAGGVVLCGGSDAYRGDQQALA